MATMPQINFESIFDWMPWAGGEMPVPHGTLIQVEYRDGSGRVVYAGYSGASDMMWRHDGVDGDIVKYRLRTAPKTVVSVGDDGGLVFAAQPTKHSHYFKDVSQLQTVDVYRVLQLFNVADPCLQHAVKKLLVAGGRGGGKDISRDIQEAIDTLQRWQAMRAEEVAS